MAQPHRLLEINRNLASAGLEQAYHPEHTNLDLSGGEWALRRSCGERITTPCLAAGDSTQAPYSAIGGPRDASPQPGRQVGFAANWHDGGVDVAAARNPTGGAVVRFL
jgi:hypothetical protein